MSVFLVLHSSDWRRLFSVAEADEDFSLFDKICLAKKGFDHLKL